MPKHMYILSAERPFSETELNRIKGEISGLFECTDVRVSDSKVFTLQSPLGPKEVALLAAEASQRFGMHFRAGGQID